MDVPLNLSLPKKLPNVVEKSDIPFQIQLEKLKRFMSNDKSSGSQWPETDEGDEFSKIMQGNSIPWAIVVSITIAILMAAVALLLIVRQRLQIAALTLSMAALQELP